MDSVRFARDFDAGEGNAIMKRDSNMNIFGGKFGEKHLH
jgi:hypothetical protein